MHCPVMMSESEPPLYSHLASSAVSVAVFAACGCDQPVSEALCVASLSLFVCVSLASDPVFSCLNGHYCIYCTDLSCPEVPELKT